jgi:hypothetical protein
VTIADDVLSLVRAHPDGLSDAEIARRLGNRHQQVNRRCRHLAEIGVIVRDQSGGVIVNRPVEGLPLPPAPAAPAPLPRSPAMSDPRWEGNVQAAVVRHLVAEGWSVVSVADTASQQRGVDVVVERAGCQMLVEVKGWPSTTYVRGARAGQPKPTAPSVQAKHWFAEVLLAVLRLRERHPDCSVALALPDMPRYRTLLGEVRAALTQLGIAVLLVQGGGAVVVWPAEPTEERT